MSTTRMLDESIIAHTHFSNPGWTGIICGQCGTPLSEGQLTCSICGWEMVFAIPPGEESSGPPMAEVGSVTADNIVLIAEMNCAQCGTPLRQGQSTCSICGWAVPADNPTDTEDSEENTTAIAFPDFSPAAIPLETEDNNENTTAIVFPDFSPPAIPIETKDNELPAAGTESICEVIAEALDELQLVPIDAPCCEDQDTGANCSDADESAASPAAEGSAPTSAEPDLAPKFIGNYALVEVAGQDETCTTYCAYDANALREVSVRKLRPALAAVSGQRQRFSDSMQAAAELSHPNIVVTFDFGEDGGIPYAVTESLAGQSLDQFAATHPDFTPVEMLGVSIDICDALHYAHEHGVVHGALKPAKVIVLPNGQIKVTAFGMAHGSLDNSSGEKYSGDAPWYLSPEQISGETVDRRTDVFAAGVMLYQLLTDNLPFAPDENDKRGTSVSTGAPHPLSRYLQSYPPELDSIMARSLARHPQDRYSTSAAMAADLCMARYAFKRILISGYLEYARACIPRSELANAREALDSLFKMDSRQEHPLGVRSFAREVLEALGDIDHQLPAVEELSVEVQRRLEPQWVAKAIASLHGQAERALAEERLPEATLLLDRALQIDRHDSRLLGMQAEIQEIYARHHKAEQLLENAETALQANRLDETRSAVDEVLRLEPRNACAHYLLASVLRHQLPPVTESSRWEHLKQTPSTLLRSLLHRQFLRFPDFSLGVRLRHLLTDPRFWCIAAAVILVLSLALGARIYSKDKLQLDDAIGTLTSALKLPADPLAGSLVSEALASAGGVRAAAKRPQLRELLLKRLDTLQAEETHRAEAEAEKQRVLAVAAEAEAEAEKQRLAAAEAENKRHAEELVEADKKRQADAEAEKKRAADAEAMQKQALAELVRKQESLEAAQKQALAEAAQKQAALEAERKEALAVALQKRSLAEAEMKRAALLKQNLWADPATGLWWSKHDNGSNLNWRQAQTYCANLILAGFSGWRLPTIEELQGIFDPAVRGDYHVKGEIQAAGGYSYWSNTREGAGQAWAFNFAGTRYPYQFESKSTTHALCVRKRE
jgi:serine/threonine protein kinase